MRNFNVSVLEADLNNISNLPNRSFIELMCMFVPEVTKNEDGSNYPGKNMFMSIQKYLPQNYVFWKTIGDPLFTELKTVLHNIMKELVCS